MFPLTPDQHHWLEVATEDEGWCSFTSCTPSRSRARTHVTGNSKKSNTDRQVPIIYATARRAEFQEPGSKQYSIILSRLLFRCVCVCVLLGPISLLTKGYATFLWGLLEQFTSSNFLFTSTQDKANIIIIYLPFTSVIISYSLWQSIHNNRWTKYNRARLDTVARTHWHTACVTPIIAV